MSLWPDKMNNQSKSAPTIGLVSASSEVSANISTQQRTVGSKNVQTKTAGKDIENSADLAKAAPGLKHVSFSTISK